MRENKKESGASQHMGRLCCFQAVAPQQVEWRGSSTRWQAVEQSKRCVVLAPVGPWTPPGSTSCQCHCKIKLKWNKSVSDQSQRHLQANGQHRGKVLCIVPSVEHLGAMVKVWSLWQSGAVAGLNHHTNLIVSTKHRHLFREPLGNSSHPARQFGPLRWLPQQCVQSTTQSKLALPHVQGSHWDRFFGLHSTIFVA